MANTADMRSNIGMVTGKLNETDGQEGSKESNDDRQSKGRSNDEGGSVDGTAAVEGKRLVQACLPMVSWAAPGTTMRAAMVRGA